MEMVDSDLGEELFERVADIEPGLCAQITGMLLELNSSVISDLINSPDRLVQAIEKAKSAFLESLNKSAGELMVKYSNGTPTCNAEMEELGEVIFEKVVSVHLDDAPQITGMILEMRLDQIKHVLKDDVLLSQTIQKAFSALHS
ncbi:polyadenylate-binding protein 1-like [Gigantopelta aegis]|uniref:polyadenylate-binding protein 1-like n=1 Tax=Gigantopelta aegis TaxID=1735272 RepID=UPI001B88747C|nr:polyadenylate-binding protein 1-like [Gigantopelta aegis]XP_041369305.1 polyadenylate-binding protein 1-like [Gigantopelta aegis]XP_041369306.1 polyadenylate-binding protein 1-like [Gigantopelta aegis]XP_041369307.1 polyadenylate-binding protein 1-like [Gigantopelta aegis]